ncbi:class A beta-lactamase [Nocardioides albus]|uniref:Beta-lactamase n=1 Tax=Nocardioides albus TaxID=1841 RepID=A0A7W5A8D8_9ACTN|nr:class A beta-lactamase [Nocardioides albus]MBB3091521.1 beta-lactamase class A [Nocardioides albus]GGU41218.1 beta-lactamase [Nocardioides albus]
MTHPTLSRRAVLGGAAAAVAATATVARGPMAYAAGRGSIAALEQKHGRHLGVWAKNMRTGRTIEHRAEERFPMLSTFKTLLGAQILRDLPARTLQQRLTWDASDLVVNSPITSLTTRNGLTVAQLCEATITRSDNTAANVLMRLTGGPAGVTAFARSLGDQVSRLDRWEPDLNSAIPGDPRDTTSPRAIAQTYTKLLLGDALDRADRDQLTTWMLANQSTVTRFGAGVPASWRLADKTGGGDYASRNDVGVTWTPDGAPIVIAALTRSDDPAAAPLDAPLEDIAAVVCAELG